MAIVPILHLIETNNSVRNFFRMNPGHFGNAGKNITKPVGSHIAKPY